MNSHPVVLKSAGVARVLLQLLRITLALLVFSKVLKLIENTMPATLSIIAAFKHLLNLFSLPLFLIDLAILILSLVWIYRLHYDLNQCYRSYPINSWDALWSVIFFIFLWKTLMTIAHHFQSETGRLRRYGLLLQRLIPVMYGIFIASYMLDKLIYNYDYLGRVESIKDFPEPLIQVAIAFQDIIALGGVFVLLAIPQTIVNAMQIKVYKINRASI